MEQIIGTFADKQGLPLAFFLRDDGETIAFLTGVIVYETEKLGRIEVPIGFQSDGCTMPGLFWWSIGHPFDMKFLREAILHDFLYATQPCDRETADMVFRDELKKAHKLSAIRRGLMYRGLRLGGWVAWNKHTKNLQLALKAAAQKAAEAADAVLNEVSVQTIERIET